MSLNIAPLTVKKVLDPRLEINESKDYVAVKGALVNSWQQFPATNINNSSFQITCNPPSRDIAVARLVYKRVQFVVTVTGTNTSGGVLLNEGFVAPRAMPLTCVTQSESITINNDTITQAPIQQYWRALLRYRNDFENRFGQFSLAPSMLDQFQSYAEGAGTVRNPLAKYGDNSFEQTRGGFSGFTIDPQTAGNTTATIRLTTVEPILVSPFVFGEGCNFYSAFSGVQNMSYTATIGNLQRVLSLVQGQGAAVGTVVLNTPTVSVESASLYFNYLTPDPTMPIPRNVETSYFSVVSYPTRSSAPIAPGGRVSLTMNSIQVTSIPKRIYVFAKKDDSLETAFTSDTYLSVTTDANPLTLTWNNNQFLSQATTPDLYNIAVKNGCNSSYSQWTKEVGSVIALDAGLDWGLYSNEAPGVIGNYQLGLTCQFENTSTETFAPTLYVVVVYEGVFNVNDGNCSHMIGVLSPQDIMDATAQPSGSYQRSQDIYGGSWKSIGDFLKKGLSYAKKHKLISKGLSIIPHPYAQLGSKAASALGYGMSGGDLTGGNLSALCD